MINKWIYISLYSVAGITFVSQGYSLPFLFLVLLSIGYIIFKRRKLALGCVVIFLFASVYYYYYDRHNVTYVTQDTTYFRGKITSTPKIEGDRFTAQFTLESKEKLYMSYKIQSQEEKFLLLKLTNRISCKFQGQLLKPEPSRNFNSFDFRKYLYRNKIHWIVAPSSISTLQCQPPQLTMTDSLYQTRDRILLDIESSLPTPLNGFVQALVFGGRANIDEQLLIAYQELGLIHLLAISGMHVGLISGTVYLLLIRIGVVKERSISIIMLLIPIYTILAGAAPSVVRAGIMTLLVLIKARFRFIPFTTLDLISIAFLIMVMVNPYYVFDVGFQLSFVVSLALILSSQTIIAKVTQPVYQLLLVSTIAQISSTPLVLYHFYQFSLLSIPLNLLYVPIITFILLPLCVLLYFFLQWDIVLSPFIEYANQFLLYLNKFALLLSSNDWHIIVLGKPTSWLLALYILAVCITFILLEKTLKWSSFIPILLVLIFHYFIPFVDSKGEVTMMDVGQGDSILIELPFRREVYLIDTGGTVTYGLEKWQEKSHPYSIGKDTIIPYLKSRGIRKISKLILTHPDQDHIGETLILMESLRMEELLIGSYHTLTELEVEIFKEAKKRKIVVKRVKAGDSWGISDSRFQVLAPFKIHEQENNASIVLAAILGNKTWLFTGDIEKEAEEDLIKRYPKLDVDILKVAHHGSQTSTNSEFLAVTKPEIAIISAGNKNRFGHPHPSVIERLSELDIVQFRTDQQGAIQFIFSSENGGTFRTKLP
ncbi:DNA internalization-related competence protein ComEC/Rec2 [Bacillus pinisoli]|uniref:DNA internalization-related competence protein ComEC/Rec2 n=1 Tax=Bacillus pinisoli TaxID=2901866 RepID=UPI001FF2009B|nr:DNA internalization-related competence protein ComEC/Rec2 [Bacillus pinisoli]